MGELAGAAGLLFVAIIERGLAGRGLAVADVRGADGDVGLVFALHPLDVNVEVQLAHAGDERLAGLGIGGDAEGGVFLHEPVQGLGHAVLVGGAGGQ